MNLSQVFLLPALLAIAVSTGVPCDMSPVQADEVRIGAWNIEWLGFPDRRARPGKDNPQTPEDLADYIHASGVDVLALEEIGVDDERASELKSTELDQVTGSLRDRHQQTWEYVLFPKTDYPEEVEDFVKRGQHVGLAWRSDKAQRVGAPFAIPVGANEEFGLKFFERRAHAVKLSFGEAKTDVIFVPIHLKSNRNEDRADDPTYTMRQREAELAAFAGLLPSLQQHFSDQDIVVLGDTNILGGQTTSKVLTERAFVDLNRDEQGTTAVWGDGSTGYKTAPFDRIYVPASQPEFSRLEMKVHRTAGGTDDEIKRFRRTLSDHYLISSTIAILADDD
jgi:endonuclease/exonuclease/phosphatase family metal-dependent hydrolase